MISLRKMRERRIAMEADKIKVPTLIIWGRHDKKCFEKW